MKILIVSQYFWPENFKINDLASELVKRGHDITIFTGMPNYPKGKIYYGYSLLRGPYKEKHSDGYIIYRSPLIPRGNSRSINLALNYLSFVIMGSLFILRLLPRKFDKIFVYETSPITQGIPAIVFKWFKRIPIFFWVTDLWPESVEAVGAVKSRRVLKWIGLLVKWIYSHCDYILISSPGFKERVMRFGVKGDKISYFPQWAEDFYQPLEKKPSLRPFELYNSSFKLIFAGNIGKAQGFETLISAAKILKENKNIQWFILGDGRDRQNAEKLVRELQLENQFHFLGSFPPQEMPLFFSHADALVLSLRQSEIFELTIPAKLQTYLACGKPIIATASGVAASLINENNLGFASPAEDANLLARNIEKIASLSISEREIMSKNALLFSSNNFQKEKLIDKLIKDFNNIYFRS